MKFPSRQNCSDVVIEDSDVFKENFVKRIMLINDITIILPIIMEISICHLMGFLFLGDSFDFKYLGLSLLAIYKFNIYGGMFKGNSFGQLKYSQKSMLSYIHLF